MQDIQENEPVKPHINSNNKIIELIPWSQSEDTRQERERNGEKTNGYPRCESHYHATIGVNQHHEIDYHATNNDTLVIRFLQSGGRVIS